MWWTRLMFSWVLAVAGHLDLGSSSKLSLLLLNWAAHFFTVDNAGASSPNVANRQEWMSLGANPLFCRYLITPRCQILSIFTKFQSPALLIQYGFIWKETMQLVSGKVEFNACQVWLVWHNSFLVTLWTFQPTLVSSHCFSHHTSQIFSMLKLFLQSHWIRLRQTWLYIKTSMLHMIDFLTITSINWWTLSHWSPWLWMCTFFEFCFGILM